MHFGERAIDEVVRLDAGMPSPGLCGALSLGEIDTEEVLGLPRFHNACVVCLRGR